MITLGICTLKEREEGFKKVIESVYDQVDVIYAVLNYYTEIPKWIRELPKVRPLLGHNTYADSGKFYFAGIAEGYYISLDDDLIVPRTFARDMCAKVDEYKCIVSLHGKRFDGPRPIKSYHRDFTTNVRCLGSWYSDLEVHVGGSGIMAFHTRDFKISIEDFKSNLMADIWVAKKAFESGVKIMALAHDATYLRYLKPVGKTIWEQRKGNDEETKLLNSFLK